MSNPLRKVRISLNTLFTIIGVLFVIGFFVVRTNLIGKVTKNQLSSSLSEYLNTRVELEEVDVTGFNVASMGPLTIYDQQGDTLLYARRVMASFDVLPLFTKQLKINTLQLIDFEIRGVQENIDAEPNFQFLVDALTPKDRRNRQIFQAFGINAIFLRQGRIRYDVVNVRSNPAGQFDVHHIYVSDLSASMSLYFTPEKGGQFRIKRLSFQEQCGIQCENAKLNFTIGKDRFALKGLEVQAGDSKIELREAQVTSQPFATLRMTGQNQWLCDMEGFNCKFSPEDIGHIDPRLSALPEDLYLNGEIHATSDTITLSPCRLFDDENLDFRGSMMVTCQSQDTALRWIEQRKIELDVHQLSMPDNVTSVLCSFLPLNKESDREMLAEVLGSWNFAGQMSGDNSEMKLMGELSSEGSWDKAPLMTDLHLEGTFNQKHHYDLKVDGKVPTVSYRGYTYHDIDVHCKSHNTEHRIDIGLDDPNIAMQLSALIEQRDEQHLTVEAQMDHFAPHALSLSKEEVLEGLTMSFHTQADLTGKNLQDLMGAIDIEEILLSRGDTMEVALAPIHIERQGDQVRNIGRISSDFLQAELGYRQDEGYQLDGNLSPTQSLTEILLLPATFIEPTTFSCELSDSLFPKSLDIDINQLSLPQGVLSLSLNAKGNYENGPLTTHLSADLISTNHKTSTSINTLVAHNLRELDIVNGIISIDDIDFNLSHGYIGSNEQGEVIIDNLVLQNERQKLKADGILGKRQPGLNFELDNLEIRPILALLGHTYLDFGGAATGDISLTSQPEGPLVSTNNLQVEDFSYIGTHIGHSNFVAYYNLGNDLLNIDAQFRTPENRLSRANGWIQLGKRDSMDLNFDLERLPIDFVSYWVGNVLEGFNGYGTGEVRLYGECKSPNIGGHPFADVSFTHSFLGTPFHFNDVIHLIDNDDVDSHIQLNQVLVSDGMGNELRATADILHDHLSHFRYTVDVDIPQSNHGFMVFNHPKQENGSLYWGRLFATGQAMLQGGDGVHNMRVNMQTAAGSTFYLSPGEDHPSEEGGKYQLLSYRTSASALEDDDAAPKKQQEYVDDTPLNLNVDLIINATEKCQVFVQLDPLSNDNLICHGRGDLSIHYDPRSDIRVFGQYAMTSGSYTITMSGDLFSKKFALQPTSTVRFSGPPSQAELDWDCTYNIRSVNLTDLDQSFATLTSMSRTTAPVDCQMKVTGPISQPVVTFGLEVKSESDEVKALVHNIIATPEMLNQEVFYLLLFGRFYTPSYAQAQQNHTGSEFSSFASSSITSQLNSFLGRMSDNFTLGTNVHSERGDFSDMEMDLAISTRLFSDRLLLNGNLGYRDPSTRIGLNNNTNSFIGDFDAEYLINQSGTVRAKAYSHYNERDYSINNALTTQGLGIVLRKDFRTFMDIWRRSGK